MPDTISLDPKTDDQQLLAYLEFLGSRLVYLIDWNRARKQLRGFLKAEPRLDLLRWSCESDLGHRGFLELGGARLIWDAVEATAAPSIHLGDRLHEVLGEEDAFAFVQFTFKTASEGLLAHQSAGLIQDRICAELLNHLKTREVRLLRIAADHAARVERRDTAGTKGRLGAEVAASRRSTDRLEPAGGARGARRRGGQANVHVADPCLAAVVKADLHQLRCGVDLHRNPWGKAAAEP